MEDFTTYYRQNSIPTYIRATHHFYCWPISLNIQKGASHHWKNVAIKCQLAADDVPSNQNRFLRVKEIANV
jgi:hypothetical protein